MNSTPARGAFQHGGVTALLADEVGAADLCSSSARRTATVDSPVPGPLVKHMCRSAIPNRPLGGVNTATTSAAAFRVAVSMLERRAAVANGRAHTAAAVAMSPRRRDFRPSTCARLARVSVPIPNHPLGGVNTAAFPAEAFLVAVSMLERRASYGRPSSSPVPVRPVPVRFVLVRLVWGRPRRRPPRPQTREVTTLRPHAAISRRRSFTAARSTGPRRQRLAGVGRRGRFPGARRRWFRRGTVLGRRHAESEPLAQPALRGRSRA
ncbi:UNVERIFIED_ORG: hypothetical protein CLV66_103464 [Actinomadura viridilutea]